MQKATVIGIGGMLATIAAVVYLVIVLQSPPSPNYGGISQHDAAAAATAVIRQVCPVLYSGQGLQQVEVKPGIIAGRAAWAVTFSGGGRLVNVYLWRTPRANVPQATTPISHRVDGCSDLRSPPTS